MDVMHERVMSLIPECRGGVKEFAGKIGVPANLVSMWKNGASKSYKNYLLQISSSYNVSVDWLCGSEEQKESPAAVSREAKDSITKKIYDIVDSADDKKRMKILEILQVIDTMEG